MSPESLLDRVLSTEGSWPYKEELMAGVAEAGAVEVSEALSYFERRARPGGRDVSPPDFPNVTAEEFGKPLFLEGAFPTGLMRPEKVSTLRARRPPGMLAPFAPTEIPPGPSVLFDDPESDDLASEDLLAWDATGLTSAGRVGFLFLSVCSNDPHPADHRAPGCSGPSSGLQIERGPGLEALEVAPFVELRGGMVWGPWFVWRIPVERAGPGIAPDVMEGEHGGVPKRRAAGARGGARAGLKPRLVLHEDVSRHDAAMGRSMAEAQAPLLKAALFALCALNAARPRPRSRSTGGEPSRKCLRGLGGSAPVLRMGTLAERLDRVGRAESLGLGHALTVCRDEFFGRHDDEAGGGEGPSDG